MRRPAIFLHSLWRRVPIGAVLILLLFHGLVWSILVTPVFGQQDITNLEGISDQGTFKVQIQWKTSDIGKENQFVVTFRDNSTGTIIEDVRYDLHISAASNNLPQYDRLNQNATSQFVVFPSVGSYTITISNIEGLGEGISFPIQVTSEIPNSDWLAAILTTIFLAIISGNNLFRRLKLT